MVYASQPILRIASCDSYFKKANVMQMDYGARGARKLTSWAGPAALAAMLMAAAPAGAADKPILTVLHSFQGGTSDGGRPSGELIADSAGTLYGTTSIGGGSGCLSTGCGVVFKLAPDGTGFKVLHSFSDGDGANPRGGLIADHAGNLYGTTEAGGVGGAGTVFKLAPDGTGFKVLHFFAGGASDGARPRAGLIADHAGSLYGTTEAGGVGEAGTVFKLAPDGTGFIVLHSFSDGDGARPRAGLIADHAGNLYGTTASSDGTDCRGPIVGCGVVFKLAPDGTYTVLHSFSGRPFSDGRSPRAGLIADGAGNLYGTTAFGGDTSCGPFGYGCGTVFKLAPDGTAFTVLHAFSLGDGAFSNASLIADGAGNLYGTTQGKEQYQSYNSYGSTVFKLAPDGTYTVLHSFRLVRAGLFADGAGNLYGTTFAGGSGCEEGRDPGCGVVYKLAGTGFVTATPFASFSARLAIGANAVAFDASFTLSSAKIYGIDPVKERVKIQVGPAFVTIPPGSFTRTQDGGYHVDGTFSGAQLVASIEPTGTLRYSAAGEARGVNLTGTRNPVQVTLTIGQHTASTAATATFHP
jgi:uncharacterized repeat protein (TIGR03803 family)